MSPILSNYPPGVTGNEWQITGYHAPDLCGAPVRGMKDTCSLEFGHKGYHSCVTYTCETCGKIRRGQPAATQLDGPSWDEGTCVMKFCFLCVRGKT